MVKVCCIKKCKSEWIPRSEISFHSFPKNEEARKKWLDSIPPSSLTSPTVTKYHSVCSKHFSLDSFVPCTSGVLRNMLNKTAVPSIFDNNDVKNSSEEIQFHDVRVVQENEAPAEDIIYHPDDIGSERCLDAFQERQNLSTKDVGVQTYQVKSGISETERRIFRSREKALKQRLKRCQQREQKIKAALQVAKVEGSILKQLKRAVEEHLPEKSKALVWNELSNNIWNSTRKIYSDDVKNFAIEMYCCSSEAYEHLKGRMSLPHPATVRKWIVKGNTDPDPLLTDEMNQVDKEMGIDIIYESIDEDEFNETNEGALKIFDVESDDADEIQDEIHLLDEDDELDLDGTIDTIKMNEINEMRGIIKLDDIDEIKQ